MPPITVLDWEPDDDGGWWIRWHDESNVGGVPLDGVHHLEEGNIDGLSEVRTFQGKRATDGNGVRLLRARARVSDGAVKSKPYGVMPPEVADWAAAYDEVVADSKERIELGVHGAAPPSALQDARDGRKIAKQHRRGPEKSPW